MRGLYYMGSVGVLLLLGCGSQGSLPTEVQGRMAEQQIATEFQRNIEECMLDRGWDMVRTPDGSGLQLREDPGSAELAQRFEAAFLECGDEAGPAPSFAPMTRAEIETLFTLQQETAECLRREGYPVVDLPTRESYVATYKAMDSGASVDVWFPHQAVPADQMEDALVTCPEPGFDEMYPEAG